MSRGSYKTTKTPKIIIQNTSITLKQEIANISAHLGLKMAAFLRYQFNKKLIANKENGKGISKKN